MCRTLNIYNNMYTKIIEQMAKLQSHFGTGLKYVAIMALFFAIIFSHGTAESFQFLYNEVKERLQKVTKSAVIDAIWFTVMAFLAAESSFWGLGLFFDYFAEASWIKPYKIRDVEKVPGLKEEMAKLKQRAIDERVYGRYRTDWIIFLGAWLASSMDCRAPCPSFLTMFKDVCIMVLILDAWIFIAHWILHSRLGYVSHKRHHSFRHVQCWFVDIESNAETLLIGVFKYALLAYYSPHAYTGLVYLFWAKFWNVLAHCGHNLPIFQFIDEYVWFIASPNLHEIHHFSHSDVNLCVFTTVLDSMFGSLERNPYKQTRSKTSIYQRRKHARNELSLIRKILREIPM